MMNWEKRLTSKNLKTEPMSLPNDLTVSNNESGFRT